MKREIFFGILLIAFVGAGLLFFSATPRESKVVIGYRNHLMYLPVFVAVEKDLFEKHGLNVEVQSFDKTSHILQAMEAGEVSASYGGVNLFDAILAKQRGGSSRVFAFTVVDKNHRVSCLVSRNYSNISQLSGRKVGHVDGVFGLVWAKVPFDSLGLDSSGFIPLKNELLLQSLEAGSVDGVYLIEPGCVKAESLGYYVVINEPIANYFADNLYFTTSLASSSLSIEKRKQIELVYDEAVDFIRANPSAARQILANYTKLKQELVGRIAIPRFLKSNEWTKGDLQRSIEALKLTGEINELNSSSLVYN